MSSNQKNAVVARSIAVTRKLAMSRSMNQNVPVGPEFLAAGILKTMPNGSEWLRNCGFDRVIPCLASIPDASAADLDNLPPVTLTNELDQLLKDKLSGYLDGRLSAKEALRILLATPGVPDRLVMLPKGGMNVPHPGIGPRELMARITKMLHTGYRLAYSYYSSNSETDLSDLSLDRSSQVFLQPLADFRKERESVRALMYSGPRGKRLSVFERYMRIYGPITADVATAVVVNELTPYVNRGPLALVRDIAYAVEPYEFHGTVGKVIDAVQTLKRDGLVRFLPEPDHCFLCSGILPTESLLGDFTQYLGELSGSSTGPYDLG